jgi:hypothetical protein
MIKKDIVIKLNQNKKDYSNKCIKTVVDKKKKA